MPDEHSSELCSYIGRVELDAFKAPNAFEKYMVFHRARNEVDHERLIGADLDLARRFLSSRLAETRQVQIDREPWR